MKESKSMRQVKTVLKEKFTAYLKKNERSQIDNLIMHMKAFRKKNKNKQHPKPVDGTRKFK